MERLRGREEGGDSQTEKDAAAEGGRQGGESAGKEQPGPVQGSGLEAMWRQACAHMGCVCMGVSARGGLQEIHLD